MARFSGLVGFVIVERTAPGVSSPKVVEKGPYFGEVKRAALSPRFTDAVNPDLTTTNLIEIMADDFVSENVSAIRFVEWVGSAWVVTEVTVQRPRLILRLGGVYSGKRAPKPTPQAPGSP